ncbi:MAG TPA: hypothetical protein VIK14_03695 [Ignavibacteria bacterium]
MKKVKIIFTLDLNTKSRPNYYNLNKLMGELGFKKYSPREVDLPHNTYYGEFNENINIKELREDIWDILNNLKLNPKRLFGGILSEWSLVSKKKK